MMIVASNNTESNLRNSINFQLRLTKYKSNFESRRSQFRILLVNLNLFAAKLCRKKIILIRRYFLDDLLFFGFLLFLLLFIFPHCNKKNILKIISNKLYINQIEMLINSINYLNCRLLKP